MPPPYHHADERRIKHLKRLALAQQSMTMCIDGCQHILDNPKLSDRVKAVLSAGIAALYASPFTEGEKLGKIEEEYEKFANPELKETHLGLVEYRNKFIAHRDLSNNYVRVHSGTFSASFFTPSVKVDDQLNYHLDTSAMGMGDNQVKLIKKLCEFQYNRISKKGEKLFKQLVGKIQKKKTFPSGEYLLGESFP